ncbi:MAG: radical SAM protein [Anaerolineales bacterium]
MITETEVKGILNPVRQPDDWFGLRYNMNLYRGCQHHCIYCDSRSACYQLDNFDREVVVKMNAVELLAELLPRKRVVGTIGTGSMNDPYMPLERRYNLTGRALQVIANNRFPVHVLTKSDLVTKDIDTLEDIRRVFATVSFTVTAGDDDLGRKVEPGAPPVSRRFAAMRRLAERGINTGVLLMPVLPFIEDTRENIAQIVEQAVDSGAGYILPAFGMTLRDRQRYYYYRQLDRKFPGTKEKYIRQFGDGYFAQARQAGDLYAYLAALCEDAGISLDVPKFVQQQAIEEELQIRMF